MPPLRGVWIICVPALKRGTSERNQEVNRLRLGVNIEKYKRSTERN